MRRAALYLLITAVLGGASRPPDIPFRARMLDIGTNEACALADVNKDGKLDIISGENWYAAPTWEKHHFRDLYYTNNYIDSLSDLALDVDKDGWMDVVTVGWFSTKITWWRNPGKAGGLWKETLVDSGFPVEFAMLADLDNDGTANEVLPQSGSEKFPLAWYEAKGGQMVKHPVSTRSYGHGIGAGDLNKDGRTDILTPKGWFEAPQDPRAGEWKYHPAWSFDSHLSFMHVLDIDEDGRPDIVTGNAHDYGLFWLRQGEDGMWTKRLIDDSWSQPHATTIVDMNGDGRKDLLTGKRYMAHNGHDPGEREPLGLYWYEYRKNEKGEVEWIRHIIEYSTRAGAGLQLPVADLDGDGDLDFASGGKSGVFLFENLTKGSATRSEITGRR